MVSRLILAFGLTGMLLGLTAPDSVSGAPATGLDNPVLSMHLTPPLDYQPGLQFLDLMKIARAWVGHQPGRVLVTSAFGGAALLVAADIGVRLIPADQPLKVGVLTALVGAPFFLYLIINSRRQYF